MAMLGLSCSTWKKTKVLLPRARSGVVFGGIVAKRGLIRFIDLAGVVGTNTNIVTLPIFTTRVLVLSMLAGEKC